MAVSEFRVINDGYDEAVPVAELNLHPRNPRRGNVGAVEELIDSNGFYGACLVQRSTGFILVGNHRYMAAKAAGATSLPVIWVNVDDLEAMEIMIGDNAGSDLAVNDEPILASLLAEIEEKRGHLQGTGHTPAMLEEMLERLGADTARPGSTDKDDAPNLPEVPRSATGDVWLLGRHRLVVGDSTDPNVIERAVGGRPAGMVWTDPPYAVDYEGKTADKLKIEGDARDAAELDLLLRAALGNARTWSAPGACWFVTGPSGPPGNLVFGSVLTDLKVWRQTCIWVKDVFVLGRQDYHHRHEVIFAGEVPEDEAPAGRLEPDLVYVGWNPGAKHQRPPHRRFDTVWEIPRPTRSSVHPTMKPVELVERALRNHSEQGALVLDPFAGSGTTLIACHRSGRLAALVEKDRGYADVICRRWEEHTGVVPILERTGAPVSFHG